MCTIFGASFAPNSTINRHKLMASFLKEGEVRGRSASGFAAINEDGMVVYKKPLPGSKLHVGRLPSDATAFIGHNRAWTTGRPEDNDNNHPLSSPNGTITLVHNGVIWNHDEVRVAMGKEYSKQLADVDSAVIGAVIEEYGLEQTDLLEGDAAAAWFDTETGDTIHLARFSHSPVVFATLEDGSFVFASTESILARALIATGLKWIGWYPDVFDSMRDGDYMQLASGEVLTESRVIWGDDWDKFDSKGYRQVTSGATTQQALGAKAPVTNIGSSGFGVGTANKGSEDRPMALINDPGKVGNEIDAFIPEALEDEDEDAFEWYRTGKDQPEAGGDPDFEIDALNVTFYSYGHDGDFRNYSTLEGLLTDLSWHAGLTGNENALVGPEEGLARWVNWFKDIGHLGFQDSDEFSFVSDREAYEQFSPALATWVTDGLEKLRTLVGA